MAKAKKSIYFCQNCGHEESKWLGQCPMCKEWNTFVEEKVSTPVSGVSRGSSVAKPKSQVVTLSSVSTTDEERTKTGIKELDRVLGGGIVQGSLVLVGGDPGIGKSTLLLQVCQKLADKQKKVLYISGEESLKQIKLRANRMGEFADSLFLLCETNLAAIQSVIEKETPDVVVIDSIQTMYNRRGSVCAGKCISGARIHECIDAARKRTEYIHFYRRTCDEGRNGCGTESVGAYGGYCALF